MVELSRCIGKPVESCVCDHLFVILLERYCEHEQYDRSATLLQGVE